MLDTLGLGKRSAEEQAQIDRKLAVIERMTTRFEKLGQDMGLDLSTFEPMSEAELEEALWDEYMNRGAERGFL